VQISNENTHSRLFAWQEEGGEEVLAGWTVLLGVVLFWRR